MQHRIVRARDVSLSVYESGTPGPSSPTLVFVHGYPDNHAVWSRVIDELSDSFHCVAYDVRGAGTSEAPSDVRGYVMEALASDLAHVVDAVSPSRPVHLVGHDWGSIQTWESVTTDRLKGRILSFTSISGPCLDHVGHLMRSQLAERSVASLLALAKQSLKSWYIAMFQLPFLPERAWTHGGLSERFPKMLAMTEGVRAEQSPTRARDGSLGVGLYRANMPQRLARPGHRRAHVPVQLIVPVRDRYVGPDLFAEIDRWVPDLERHDVDAGHWVVLGDPSRISGLVRDYVTRIEARSTVSESPRG